ncbi:DUF58 domain-containing protein [Nisaea acidiphila]|uniref:DUF58 domain-containing protein n=1 Tax=Nisaea acidiphila TaxID=1862145 RepID=A0A9J7ANL5_9PROT|nr:DUF58 domain-containing protein [Nisaea acidiphila]UUX48530.1 DUF58 domain-containing protein [Nisaea acidiphila]
MRHHAEELAGKFSPLLVAAERVAATVSQGMHGRRRVGMGEAFWQFRPYQVTDSVRRIDWRRTARSDEVYVRETEWEASQSIWIWRDASPSMRFASDRALPEKAVRTDLIVLALGALLIEAGERIALLGEGTPPRGGRNGLNIFANTMENARDSAASRPALEHLPRHAAMVLVSDFMEPARDYADIIGHYAASGIQGFLLQVTDPAEEAFPFQGRIRFEGTESETAHLLRRADTVREAYVQKLARHRAQLKDACRRAGWFFAQHVTTETPESALLQLYAAMTRQDG